METGVIGTGFPASSARRIPSAPSGSIPTMRASGRASFTPTQTPETSPPPPIGHTTTSTSGQSSTSSSPSDACPAMTVSSSKGWTNVRPWAANSAARANASVEFADSWSTVPP